jgi:hypothetical protein
MCMDVYFFVYVTYTRKYSNDLFTQMKYDQQLERNMNFFCKTLPNSSPPHSDWGEQFFLYLKFLLLFRVSIIWTTIEYNNHQMLPFPSDINASLCMRLCWTISSLLWHADKERTAALGMVLRRVFDSTAQWNQRTRKEGAILFCFATLWAFQHLHTSCFF